MFAKPVPKKPVAVVKQKVPSKPKTLSVKAGVKTSQNVKKYVKPVSLYHNQLSLKGIYKCHNRLVVCITMLQHS